MDIPYHIFPLGEGAVTLDLGNQINTHFNNKVIAMHQWLMSHPFEGMEDVIVAYSSITIFYDPFLISRNLSENKGVFRWVGRKLEEAFQQSEDSLDRKEELIRIPVCYEDQYAPDMNRFSEEKQMDRETIIHLHINRIYRVFMIGFMPGFPYMGEVDERLIIARKQRPEPVMAGSVGIAGSQTGIYPFNSPGGWHIIGRTPLPLFYPNAGKAILLESGNLVQFYPINKEAFQNFQLPSTS